MANQSVSGAQEELINICVGKGPETKTFHIHKSLLEAQSPYFAHQLHKMSTVHRSWWEGNSKTIKLPGEDPEIFTFYEKLLYSGIVPIHANHAVFGVPQTQEEIARITSETIDKRIAMASDEVYYQFIALYVFCDRILDTQSKNRIMAAFVEFMQQKWPGHTSFPNSDRIHEAYEGTLYGSKLREFLVDLFMCHGGIEWRCGNPEYWPRDFLVDCAQARLSGEWVITSQELREEARYSESVVPRWF